MSERAAFNFDTLATIYERIAEPLTASFVESALAMADLEPGRSLIDVAAGPGALAVAAAGRGARVLATDVAPAMVNRAADRLRPYAGCEARTMSCETLAAADAQFDAAVSMFGVMMVPQWREGLAELVRVTRPGGRVVVSAWADPEGPKTIALLKAAFGRAFPDRPFWPNEPRIWTEAEAKDALTAAGCRDVAVRLEPGELAGLSGADFVEDSDPMFRVVPGYAALADADRAVVQAGLRENLRPFVQADGSIRLPMPAFIVSGVRS